VTACRPSRSATRSNPSTICARHGALRTGVGFLPHTLVTMIVGWRVAPRLMKRLDDRTLIVTCAIVAAVGFLWQSRITAASDYLTECSDPGSCSRPAAAC
jgi:hypothetical protein